MKVSTAYTRRIAAGMMSSLIGIAAMLGAPAYAQETAPAPFEPTSVEADGSGTAIDDVQDEQSRGQTYQPDYFERFGPRNALDMVREIPGFSISGSGGNSRGLGQADQNVLINGARLSSKSDSARDQLGRIPADNVVRIEIVDGTALDIPGLTGQVANIVVLNTGLSGQFRWEGAVRTTLVDPEWYGGEISLSGSTGALEFTIALENENRRFGAEGIGIIRDGAGALLQTDDGGAAGAFDKPTLTANLGYDVAPDIRANLNLSYARSYFQRQEDELQFGPGIDDLSRAIRRAEDGYEYEISGDITFPLGSGNLKLIALESFDSEDFADGFTDTFDDALLIPEGGRFTRLSEDGERIGRLEYSWPMWGGDWQLSGEAAFNRTARVSGLFETDTTGTLVPIDFPEGTGGVTEDRYEGALSYSRQLTSKLALQTTLAAEYSKLSQTGSAANTRSFQRPKGSISLAWQPQSGLDISTELSRRVGQLSFGDFLARVNLDDGNANAGNNELVPEQFWQLEVQINKSLGEWGSATLNIDQRWIEDFIDIIPLSLTEESRGNIDQASRFEVELEVTLRLDKLGIPGATMDVELELVDSSVDDPLEGIPRAFSRTRDRLVDIDYRHDIPGSDWAYGGGMRYGRETPYFRLSELGNRQEGPTFANLFIENKDVLGLTLRATYANLLGGRERFDRTVFDGPRTDGIVEFTEARDRRIGPIFRFSVSGNF